MSTSPTTTGAMASGSDAVTLLAEALCAAAEPGKSPHEITALSAFPPHTLRLDRYRPSAEALWSRLAALAAPPPVVPEEVRRLFGFAADEDWSFLYDRLGDGGRARFWKAVLGDFRTLLSATPSGRADTPLSDKDDDSHRCGICDEPLIAGQIVLTDVELGTVHAACCGPERDSYVKDINTGEPLGPDDPIPAGRPYKADTPPAGGGAVPGGLVASITEKAKGYDTPSEADPRRRFTPAQIDLAIRAAYSAGFAAAPAAPAAPEPVAGGDGLSQAARDVLAERRRQVEGEGWTAAHDDTAEREGQMAGAAACYAFGAKLWTGEQSYPGYLRDAATVWPWHERFWKPTTRRRDLVKAGALILAEIDRLDRAAEPTPANAGAEGGQA